MYLSMLEKIPHNVAEVSLADGLKTSPWDFYYHSTLVAPTTLTLLFSYGIKNIQITLAKYFGR